jgi:hypothetical protein
LGATLLLEFQGNRRAAGLPEAVRVNQTLETHERSSWRSELRESKQILTLAIGLVVIDALLLLANGLFYLAEQSDSPGGFLALFHGRAWNGEMDGSLVEYLGYLQLGSAAIVLFIVAFRSRQPVFAAWGCIFLVMTADDSLRLHENIGRFLATSLHFPSVLHLRPNDLGELAAWGIFGLVLGTALVVAHVKSSRAARHDSWVLFGLTVFLACFAVVLDMLEIVIWSFLPQFAHGVMVLGETAGELGAMTIILIGALLMAKRRRLRRAPATSQEAATPAPAAGSLTHAYRGIPDE